MKDGHGDGICPRTCSSEHQTTCSSTSPQSYPCGYTSLLDASTSKTVSYWWQIAQQPKGGYKKSNFTKLGKSLIQASVRIEATQKYATLFMSLEIRSYSQWFKGVMNKAADALSCDENRSDNELTNTIKSFCPSQVPSHFEIQQLPKKITSWLTELLLKSPVSKQLCETHTRSKLGHGVAGMITRSQSESETTPSSRTSHENNNTQSLEPLPWLSEKDVFQKEIMNNWLQAQLKVPCSMYLQPSENTGTQTQHLTRRKSLCGLYNENLGCLKTLT